MRLSKQERETIVVFNDGESTATITTCNERWCKTMATVWGKGEKLGSGPYYEWVVPKGRVRIPRPVRQVTEERKKSLAKARISQNTAIKPQNPL